MPCPPLQSPHPRWSSLQEALCSHSCVPQSRFFFLIGSNKISSSGASDLQCSLSGTCSRSAIIFFLKVSVIIWYFVFCVKQDLMTPHRPVHLVQSFSDVYTSFSSKHRAFSRFDAFSASITSHLHISKLFLLLNFTTSIFIGWWFTDFTLDQLFSVISSVDFSK